MSARTRRRTAPAAGLVAAALLAAATVAAAAPDARHPIRPRSAVVIEPPRIGVGQIAEVDVVVLTPPGHRLLPVEPPAAVDGLWILDAEAAAVEREPLRWTHRTRIRVRGRAPGPVSWPALDLALEGPEGERWTLRTEPRALEVVSVLPELPDRVAPFRYRLPPAEPGVPAWAAAAAGALGTLAVVLAGLAVRRRRHREVEPPRPPGAPWTAALEELDRAADDAEADWRGASDRAARALRRYVGRRFGVRLDARTTEELEARTPPFVLASRWPGLLALLRRLDEERFRSASEAGAAARLRATLAEASRWVESSIPPEFQR